MDALLARSNYYRKTACLTLTAIHPDGKHHTPSRHIPLNQPEQLYIALEKLLKTNRLGWGAYFGVGLRRQELGRYQRGGLADVVALPALFADIDRHDLNTLTDVRRFSPRPSCIVNSGGGLHISWWLNEPTTNFTHANQLLRALTQYFDADRTNVAQCLRLPMSLNTKPKRANALCKIIELNERRYQLADFDYLLTKQPVQLKKLEKLHTVQHRKQRISVPHNLNPDLVQAVADRLCMDYGGYIKSNGYVAALCPCGHAHDSPGNHFNFDPSHGIGLCFGKHGRLMLKDLCQILGISPANYGGIFVL